MTINDFENYDSSKASETWMDAYATGNHVDLETFEQYSIQFLSQATDPTATAEELIGNLCLNTFSGVAISSLVEYKMGGDETKVEKIPVLNIILHPFKEIRSTSFKEGEKLYGILVDSQDPKQEVKTLEFLKPMEIFGAYPKTKDKKRMTDQDSSTEMVTQTPDDQESGDNEEGIATPTFHEFFDENFLKASAPDEYKPLNNATEIAPFDNKSETEHEEQDGTYPKPMYLPRKVIPITPVMSAIIWEQHEDNFDGIINGIREHAWTKVKAFNDRQARKAYLFLIYRTIQAFWVHGQRETTNDGIMAKFVRNGPEKVAKITDSKWAIDKTFSITESLALNLGNLKIRSTQSESIDREEEDERSTRSNNKNVRPKGKNNGPRPGVSFQDEKEAEYTRNLLMVAKDMVATLVNKGTDKDTGTINENSWTYKAVKLASSKSTIEAPASLSQELLEITKLSEKHARDMIAHNLNQLRRTNFRIDKIMAGNIRTLQVFRASAEVTGNLSFFHCFPRQVFELQDMVPGEELEMRMKMKAITANIVKAQFESKLGIATSAHQFIRQAFNFWQLIGFVFGDDSWLAKMTGTVYEKMAQLEQEIESIAHNDREYIVQIAAIWNNEFHLFLNSCIEANGDIQKVRWSRYDALPETLPSLIQTRTKPSFILTDILHLILDQSMREMQQKRNAENAFGGNGGNYNNRDKFKKINGGDEAQKREGNPNQKNEKIRASLKMSMNEFKKVISPFAKSCPKIGDKSVCAMFNIVGRCHFGARCHHSHDELPDDVCEAIENWVAECKKKAKDKTPKRNGGENKDNKD